MNVEDRLKSEEHSAPTDVTTLPDAGRDRSVAEDELVVRGLRKSYGHGASAVHAVRGVDLRVRKGELLALLGPSGCGKTTTLRCIAGLETADDGVITIGGKAVADPLAGMHQPPDARNIGMVFQSYALWPHLSVEANVAYPLKMLKVSRQERTERVHEALAFVDCGSLGGRYPSELSGGQQQRISLARAIVGRPRILLFDEPLSNLDAKLREQMRYELLELKERLGITGVYVTHDQVEAMTVADRIAILDDGLVIQEGSAVELYNQPHSLHIARFMGPVNTWSGRVTGVDADGISVNVPELGEVVVAKERVTDAPAFDQLVHVAVRAEAIQLRWTGGSQTDKQINCFNGRVAERVFLGLTTTFIIESGSHRFESVQVGKQVGRAGQAVTVHVEPTDWFMYTDEGGDDNEER